MAAVSTSAHLPEESCSMTATPCLLAFHPTVSFVASNVVSKTNNEVCPLVLRHEGALRMSMVEIGILEGWTDIRR